MSVKIRTRKLQNGETAIFLDCYSPMGRNAGAGKRRGKRTFEWLGLRLTGDKAADREILEAASLIRAQREIDFGLGNAGLQNKGKSDFISYAQKIAKTKKARYWKPFITALKQYAGNAGLPFRGLTESWLQGFQDKLKAELGPGTAQCREASCLKVVLNASVRAGFLQKSPYAAGFPSLPKHQSQRVYLLEPEIQKLADCPCRVDVVRRAFLFCCATGLRFSDCRALSWADIDKAAAVLNIRQTKTKGLLHIPLSETALSLLKQSMPGTAIPIPSRKVFEGLPIVQTADRELQIWAETAGLGKHISSHVARHSFAVCGLVAGLDIYTVSRLMGHASVKQTEGYLSLVKPLMNRAAEKGVVIKF